MPSNAQKNVELFKQLLFWPVQLLPDANNPDTEYWDRMKAWPKDDSAWRAIPDEFTQKDAMLRESSYQHFISYLPFAQRFLYGEGIPGQNKAIENESPVHIFYRNDIRKVRVQLTKESDPFTLRVEQCTLFFFYDVDIAMLCLEVNGENLPLKTVMDLQYYFGRTYPSHWEENEQGYLGQCLHHVAWLDKHDNVLSESNYEDKSLFLDYAKQTRTVKDASHWSFLMAPMVQHYAASPSNFRYRKVGYRRSPIMSYIGMEDPTTLTRGDMIRLGLFTAYSDSDTLPYSEKFLESFEAEHCYDRNWDPANNNIKNTTRILSSEQGLVLLGSTKNNNFTDAKMGSLLDFNAKFFFLFLITHFQKASIMMMSDKLVHAICDLDVTDKDSYKVFSERIKLLKESFLRFTHRYWFHEVSNQVVAKDIFHMMREHNDSEEKMNIVSKRIVDMQEFIDNQEVRIQSDTVIRLTIVSIFGLIFTMSIGLLDINIFHLEHDSLDRKLGYFGLIFLGVSIITFITVLKSKKLSYIIDALANKKK